MAEPTATAYEVTATKRRPKTFDELAGQEFVVSTLKNSIQRGFIAPAYLFSGPRGCGKTSAARILARSLNCEKSLKSDSKTETEAGYDGNPCGICGNCLAIGQGSSIDVLEIDGATNKGIDDIKQIKDEVLFAPQSSRYKVYIIDEVHMLTIQAFNALLKTIEEPPPYIVFIFATTELHKVPATIKSRCQQFNFRLIPIETVQEILRKICTETGIEAEDDALFWIAKESTGSLRDAFTLFDQVVSFSAGNIQSKVIREKLGIIGLEKLNALAEACAVNDTQAAFALTDEILASGVAIEQFIIDFAGYYRSLLLLKNGIIRESLLGFRPSFFSEKVLETFDSIRFEQALDILLNCYRDIRYSVSPRFELENAVSKLAWLNRWVSPTELREAIEGVYTGVCGQAKVLKKPANQQHQPSGQGQPKTAQETPSKPAVQTLQFSGDDRSLSDGLKQLIAAKESTAPNEEDVPMWNNAAPRNQLPEEHDNNSINNLNSEVPQQVSNVLSLIPGTMID